MTDEQLARGTERGMDFDLEKREVTEERMFLTMEGEEFELNAALSFLDGVSGTDGFASYVVPDHGEREFAEFLLEHDVVGRRANGGLFDRGGCADLHDAIEDWYIEYIEEYAGEDHDR